MLVFKMSPELGDGVSASIVDQPERVLDAVRTWLDEFKDQPAGERFTIETVEMTETEIEALPHI